MFWCLQFIWYEMDGKSYVHLSRLLDGFSFYDDPLMIRSFDYILKQHMQKFHTRCPWYSHGEKNYKFIIIIATGIKRLVYPPLSVNFPKCNIQFFILICSLCQLSTCWYDTLYYVHLNYLSTIEEGYFIFFVRVACKCNHIFHLNFYECVVSAAAYYLTLLHYLYY